MRSRRVVPSASASSTVRLRRIAMATAALTSACCRRGLSFGSGGGVVGAAAFQSAQRRFAPASSVSGRSMMPISPSIPLSPSNVGEIVRGRWSSTTPAATSTRLFGRITTASDGDDGASDGGDSDFEPTWTYTPYGETGRGRGRGGRGRGPGRGGRGRGGGGRGGGGRGGPQQRYFSTAAGDWTVPQKITVPEDRVEVSFVRSSGAGGQNVNKLNTKVELRFKLSEASWIPQEVRDRLRNNEGGRISKEGYFAVTSQEHRTQAQNRKDAVKKLEDMILTAYPRPKVRKLRKGVGRKAKERNKEDKRKRSQVKANRKQVDY